jgi:hypothetical protein
VPLALPPCGGGGAQAQQDVRGRSKGPQQLAVSRLHVIDRSASARRVAVTVGSRCFLDRATHAVVRAVVFGRVLRVRKAATATAAASAVVVAAVAVAAVAVAAAPVLLSVPVMVVGGLPRRVAVAMPARVVVRRGRLARSPGRA